VPAVDIEGMSLNAIITRWPQTIRVFVAQRLHCVGCPISDFHLLSDAAREHGQDATELVRATAAAIEGARLRPTAPSRFRRRSTAAGEGP